MFKPQRRIAEADLPTLDAKLQLLSLAIRRLTEAGYVYIGMDHFAKPDDDLAVAQRQGRLHRNFQGYSTYAETDLLGFGISAIGQVGPTYSQNVKTLDEYYDRLDRGTLPVMRGIELTADDLVRRALIQSLMCHFEVPIESLEVAHLIDFRKYFAHELEELAPFRRGRHAHARPAVAHGHARWAASSFAISAWCSTAICGRDASVPATRRSFEAKTRTAKARRTRRLRKSALLQRTRRNGMIAGCSCVARVSFFFALSLRLCAFAVTSWI